MEILVSSMKAMQSKLDDIAKNPEAFQLQLTHDRLKLGCKIGNLEASFNRHISDLNSKLSADINMIHDEVHHNEKSVEKLKELKLASTCELNPLLKVETATAMSILATRLTWFFSPFHFKLNLTLLPYIYSVIKNDEKQQLHCCTRHFQELSLSFSIDSFSLEKKT